MWNLVENAAKYGAPPITLGAATDGGDVLLSVSDEGAGIAGDERELVLGPFYRQDKARTPSPRMVPHEASDWASPERVRSRSPMAGPSRSVLRRGRAGGEHGCRVTLRIPARRTTIGTRKRPE